MNNILRNFYENENEREAVKEFLLLNLQDYAIEQVFSKKPVEGIFQAKEVIEKAFEALAQTYGKVDKVNIENQAI